MPGSSHQSFPHPALVASAAHVFVDDLTEPQVDQTDIHHLERVLRLRSGESVTASDGAGSWRKCVWRGAGSALAVEGPVVFVERPHPVVTVGFALIKGDRPERVVRGLTETGVDRVMPLVAARSVVRWERAEAHVEGLRRVARAASMQARRMWLPEVEPLVSTGDLMARLRAGAGSPGSPDAPGHGPALAQPGGSAPSLDRPCIMVGPEGGWDPAELAAAPALVGLGPMVMRAETAALAAGVILCALRAGVVGEASL